MITDDITSKTPAPFESFPKIPRLRSAMVLSVTEKIDGTNAQIYVPEDPDLPLQVGSRNRWITPGQTTDNFGFAAWVAERADELRAGLGPGRHFGEWYGAGIGRRYGLAERRLTLFNWRRWTTPEQRERLPSYIETVPVLYSGAFDATAIHAVREELRTGGSRAVPGFMDPEGYVVEFRGELAKFTFDGDGHKDAAKRPAAA